MCAWAPPIENIRLSADAALIEAARARAPQEQITLNAQFRLWLAEHVHQRERLQRYDVVMKQLRGKVRVGRKHARADQARLHLEAVLLALLQGAAGPARFHRSLDVQARYRFSPDDSLIVAAALRAGCRRLLSEDLQRGQRIAGLTIEDPFGNRPRILSDATNPCRTPPRSSTT